MTLTEPISFIHFECMYLYTKLNILNSFTFGYYLSFLYSICPHHQRVRFSQHYIPLTLRSIYVFLLYKVNTQGGGDGSLGVSIRGPRKHTVTECSVIYTGDDFYEVLYEVSLAGFYVVSVKWSDRHITDSPFIVKVSF